MSNSFPLPESKTPDDISIDIFLLDRAMYSDTTTANNVPDAENHGANELINFQHSILIMCDGLL